MEDQNQVTREYRLVDRPTRIGKYLYDRGVRRDHVAVAFEFHDFIILGVVQQVQENQLGLIFVTTAGVPIAPGFDEQNRALYYAVDETLDHVQAMFLFSQHECNNCTADSLLEYVNAVLELNRSREVEDVPPSLGIP